MSGGKVEYYAIDGVPGRYFACPKGVGKLSDKACSRLYTEAMSQRGLREGLRFQCRGCSLGATHSGVPPLNAASSRFLTGLTCARCLRSASRLIRGMICVSCYNREREVLIGRNAKGNAPVHGRQVGPATVAYLAGKDLRVKRIDRVASCFEAVLSVIRWESNALSFGWIGSGTVKETACG